MTCDVFLTQKFDRLIDLSEARSSLYDPERNFYMFHGPCIKSQFCNYFLYSNKRYQPLFLRQIINKKLLEKSE
jgi:hypothetical protein